MGLYSADDASKPGPRPSSAASVAPAGVGVRTAPQGRPRVVAPPPTPVVPPPNGQIPDFGASVSGPQPAQPVRPQPQALPSQPSTPPPAAGGPKRAPQQHELDLLPTGGMFETPVGTFTQTPNGPMIVLNEQGAQAYQARIEKFYEQYQSFMPPELRSLDLPLPNVTVGQKFFHPWANRWMTV